jgi:hypothetical protein
MLIVMSAILLENVAEKAVQYRMKAVAKLVYATVKRPRLTGRKNEKRYLPGINVNPHRRSILRFWHS